MAWKKESGANVEPLLLIKGMQRSLKKKLILTLNVISHSFLSDVVFKVKLLCAFMMEVEGTYMTWCLCSCQWIILCGWFSLSTIAWVPGIELRLSGFQTRLFTRLPIYYFLEAW